jgi:hypothetical protein
MSTKAAKQVNLNIDELKEFSMHIINNNRFLQESGKIPTAVGVEGGSGIGKTSTIIQIANKLGLNFVKLNLAQIEELGDLVGFPVRQFQLCAPNGGGSTIVPKSEKRLVPTKKKVKKTETMEVEEMQEQEVDDFKVEIVKKQVLEGGKFVTKDIEVKTPIKVRKEVPVKVTRDVEVEVEEEVMVEEIVPSASSPTGCIWVDEQAISEYTRQGYTFTGEKRMSYCPPEWIANKSNGGILMLDDWNRADIRFIQAVMELIDRQEYISWKLPKDWHIFLTSNPDDGEYLVQSIDNAQKTRFIGVNLKFEASIWAEWAEKEGIDGRCINFLLMHPELVKDKVNARSATMFFNAISSLKDFNVSLPLIQMIGEGSVGPEFSTMFTLFINNRLDKLITPHDVLLNDNEAYVVGELRKAIGTGKDYRADIASTLATRAINYGLHYAENNSIPDKTIQRIIRLCTDPDIFTNDLQYILVKKFLNGNKQKFQKIMVNAEVQKMSMK